MSDVHHPTSVGAFGGSGPVVVVAAYVIMLWISSTASNLPKAENPLK